MLWLVGLLTLLHRVAAEEAAPPAHVAMAQRMFSTLPELPNIMMEGKPDALK